MVAFELTDDGRECVVGVWLVVGVEVWYVFEDKVGDFSKAVA
jgi:hypothetical protein